MKITITDGNVTTTHEFRDIEEFRQYLKLRAEMGQPVQIADLGVSIRSAMTAPPVAPVAPEIVGDEDCEDEEPSVHVKTVYAKPRKTSRRRASNPPIPVGAWPKVINLTSPWNTIFKVLKTYPQGMGTKDMADLLGINETQARGWAARMRKATPLAKLVGNTYQLTVIGNDESLKVVINDDNPSQVNKQLGWQPFVALDLKDGSRRARHYRTRS